jgi:two-component system, OmpR family, sensor histidine kinase VicK
MTGKSSKPANQKKSAAVNQNTAATPNDNSWQVSDRQPNSAETVHTETADRSQQQQLESLAEITFKIRQSLQLTEILRTIVTEVQQLLRADRVLIYQVLPNGTGKPISEAVLPEYPAILGIEFPEEVFPTTICQRASSGSC